MGNGKDRWTERDSLKYKETEKKYMKAVNKQRSKHRQSWKQTEEKELETQRNQEKRR